MTIDTLIQMREEAKGLLPSSGKAPMIFPDGLLVRSVHAQEASDAVVITDQDDEGKQVSLGQQWRREEDPFDIFGD